MKFHIEKKKRGNCFPFAYNTLKQLDDSIFKHQEHSLRHPLGIYNTSLFSLFEELEKIVTDYQNLIEERKDAKLNSPLKESIISSLSNLLHLMQSHYDDCYSILKTFYSFTRASKKNIFADKWLESVSCPGIKYFKNSIQKSRQHVADYVNKIKHNQARLMASIWKNKDDLILGYILHGKGDGNAIGPYNEINNGSPVSLNREISLILYEIYDTGYHLSEAIKLVLHKEKNYIVNDSFTAIENSENKLQCVIKTISSLKQIVLPSEQTLPFPTIEHSGSHEDFEIILEYPGLKKAATPSKMAVSSEIATGDGVTTQFKGKLF